MAKISYNTRMEEELLKQYMFELNFKQVEEYIIIWLVLLALVGIDAGVYTPITGIFDSLPEPTLLTDFDLIWVAQPGACPLCTPLCLPCPCTRSPAHVASNYRAPGRPYGRVGCRGYLPAAPIGGIALSCGLKPRQCPLLCHHSTILSLPDGDCGRQRRNLSFWRRVHYRTCLAHRFHGFLHAEQHGRLGRFEMAGRDSGEDGGRRGGVIRKLANDNPIVLAEAVVHTDQPTAQVLHQRLDGGTSVLRILGQGRPGFTGVSKLYHIERHRFVLLSLVLKTQHVFESVAVGSLWQLSQWPVGLCNRIDL